MNFSTQLKQLHITLRISCLILHKDCHTLSDYPVLALQDLTVSSQRLIRKKDKKFLIGRWGIHSLSPSLSLWVAGSSHRHEISHHFPQ